MPGIFSYNKPSGITSAHFLNQLKRSLNLDKEIKIGHGGTLDKFADGLLVVAIGRQYTKQLSDILKNSQKEYVAEIEFGQISTTLDPDGEITPSGPIPSKKEILEALQTFPLNSPFSQTAPAFSAKKISGQRSSDLIRQNQPIEPKISSVTLYEFSIIDYSPPTLKIRLLVSSGFYIRSFAHDLAQKIDTNAYLKSLTRTRIITSQKEYSLNLTKNKI